MSCTFLKVGSRYINPEYIISFRQQSDGQYLEILTTTGTLYCGIEIVDFIKMLQEVNYTVKEFQKEFDLKK